MDRKDGDEGPTCAKMWESAAVVITQYPRLDVVEVKARSPRIAPIVGR